VKGKLSYIAPENVRGDSVDHRSDLFSVGVMLWEAATGRRFWQGFDELEIYQKLVAGDLPTESGARDIPPQLFAIIAQALAPNPNHRFTSAAQMRAALGALPQLIASKAAVSGYLYQLFVDERRKFHERMLDAIERLESGQWPTELPRLGTERSAASTPDGASNKKDTPAASYETAPPLSVRTNSTVRTTFESEPPPTASNRRQIPALVIVSLAAGALVLAVWMIVRDTPQHPQTSSVAATSLDSALTSPLPSSRTVVVEPAAPSSSASSNAPPPITPSPPRISRPGSAPWRPAAKKVEAIETPTELTHAPRTRRRLDADDPWTK
jgi:serine/threonine-protein kinase